MPKRSRSLGDDSDVLEQTPPKRRRRARSCSASFVAPSAPAPPALHDPLTLENLYHHNSTADQFEAGDAPPSDSLPNDDADYASRDDDDDDGTSMSNTPREPKLPTVDPELKLGLYGIYVRKERRLPPELHRFVEAVVREPRDRCSPNARRIANNQSQASRLSERDGLRLLVDDLLFHDDSMSRISSKTDMNLERMYMPPPRDPNRAKEFGPLEQPQPDVSVGYRTTTEKGEQHAAFTEMQEFAIVRRTISSGQHFPFITAQWKSPRNGGTIHDAFMQSARDGAFIGNYLYQFHSSSAPPTVVDTVHFSLCVDMYTAWLCVHWREQDDDGLAKYYMKDIERAFLQDAEQVSVLRHMLWNIADHAMGDRLDRIKNTIDKPSSSRKRGLPTPSLSSRSDCSTSAFALPTPDGSSKKQRTHGRID